jgi:hypothetical protein
MITEPRYLLLAALGLALIAWGLPASHRLKAPWNSLAALVVLAGVGLLMLGALLTVLPDFFQE